MSDRITVLRDGRFVLTGKTSSLDRPALIRAMVGRDVAEDRHGADTDTLPVALKAEGLRRHPAVRGADLTLHAGEVLGVGRSHGLRAHRDRPAARRNRQTRQRRDEPLRQGLRAA